MAGAVDDESVDAETGGVVVLEDGLLW